MSVGRAVGVFRYIAEFAIGLEKQSDCDAEIEKFDLTLVEIPNPPAHKYSDRIAAPAERGPPHCPASLSERRRRLPQEIV